MLIKCPECEGSGADKGGYGEVGKPCPLCKGSGKVQVVVRCVECAELSNHGTIGICQSEYECHLHNEIPGIYHCVDCEHHGFMDCPHCHKGWRPLTEDEDNRIKNSITLTSVAPDKPELIEALQYALLITAIKQGFELDGQPVKIMEG